MIKLVTEVFENTYFAFFTVQKNAFSLFKSHVKNIEIKALSKFQNDYFTDMS